MIISQLPATYDVCFDFDHVELSLKAIGERDDTLLLDISRLPGASHMAGHASRFARDTAPSALEITRSLLLPFDKTAQVVDETRQALAAARQLAAAVAAAQENEGENPPQWLVALTDLLPPGQAFRGTLYLTFGYDIGVVSHPGEASVNLAVSHIRKDPAQLPHYACHELHHAAYASIHPLPVLEKVDTRAAMIDLTRYLTHLEGLGMYAGWLVANAQGNWQGDPDYVVLTNPKRARGILRVFGKLLAELHHLPKKLSVTEVGDVLSRFGSPDKLFHYAGFLMAKRIDEMLGRDALLSTMEIAAADDEGSTRGPEAFFELAEAL